MMMAPQEAGTQNGHYHFFLYRLQPIVRCSSYVATFWFLTRRHLNRSSDHIRQAKLCHRVGN